MSIFVKPTAAPIPKTKDVRRIATFYAGILVIMAVAQLFTFEEFLTLVASFDLPGGVGFAHFITTFLITVEVLALPFLLRMPLSPAFRWVSMVSGWFVACIWAVITIWLAVTDSIVSNVGFLGTAIEALPGWWAIFMSMVFGILAAWSSWGMWPAKRSAKRVKRQTK